MRIQPFVALALGGVGLVAACKPSRVKPMKSPPGAVTLVDSIVYYEVDGNNAAEVNRDIAVRGPTSGRAYRAAASYRYSYTFRDSYSPVAGGCKADVKFNGVGIITLPRWKMVSQARPIEQRAWQVYVIDVKDHEEVHRGIFLAGLDSAWQAASAETAPDCASLRPKVRAAITAAMRHSQNEQDKFDEVDMVDRRPWVPPS